MNQLDELQKLKAIVIFKQNCNKLPKLGTMKSSPNNDLTPDPAG